MKSNVAGAAVRMTTIRAIQSRSPHLPPLWLAAVVMSVVIANCWYLSWTVAEMVLTDSAADWHVIAAAADHGMVPGLYGSGWYQWSPLLVPIFQVLAPMGLLLWRLLHVVAAFALHSWTMRLIALASWPFWLDFSVGNVGIFLVVVAVWAIRGSRVASVTFIALTMLLPRPLMIPLTVWLLWKRPDLRLAAVITMTAIGAGTLATGLAGEWYGTLTRLATGAASWSSAAGGWDFNIGPSRFIGASWLLIGIPLSAWLTWKGRLGLASLAISPYILPFYALFGLLEFQHADAPRKHAAFAS